LREPPGAGEYNAFFFAGYFYRLALLRCGGLVRGGSLFAQIAHIKSFKAERRFAYPQICVRRGFSFDAVGGKGEIARRKNHRLRKLNIHIVEVRQIPDASGYGDEALVFDSAGLRAVAWR
jgi:hypothetical protein